MTYVTLKCGEEIEINTDYYEDNEVVIDGENMTPKRALNFAAAIERTLNGAQASARLTTTYGNKIRVTPNKKGGVTVAKGYEVGSITRRELRRAVTAIRKAAKQTQAQ